MPIYKDNQNQRFLEVNLNIDAGNLPLVASVVALSILMALLRQCPTLINKLILKNSSGSFNSLAHTIVDWISSTDGLKLGLHLLIVKYNDPWSIL